MTRFTVLSSAVVIAAIAPSALFAAQGLTAPSLTVGRNLQMGATVGLPQPAPQAGVQIIITSGDPSRLLLSDAPDKAGSARISLTVPPRLSTSPGFWLQGLADSGSVAYTVTAEGVGSATGAVTLAHSAIVILGPFKQPSFQTTPRGAPATIKVISAALDSAGKVAEEQQIAGGSQVEVPMANSNPNAGKPGASRLTLAGGSSVAMTYFEPAGEGKTTLTPVQPPGFTPPTEFATVVAAVDKPGLAIVGDMYLGKDLQTPASVCLGEMAPPGGLKVTLVSADGSKLLLSTREDQLGSASITLAIPAGQGIAQYYIQALGDSGEVTYGATAPGFRSTTARIGLALSGVIVAYERYGPPDEAAVLRKGAAADDRAFAASLSDAKEHPVHVVAWTVYLHPDLGMAADITVQTLRAGVSATVALTSSDPGIGTVESPLTIKSGENHVDARFIPLSKGTTVISINTPPGFATPKNATSVPATVND
jgi:hypothetical protein